MNHTPDDRLELSLIKQGKLHLLKREVELSLIVESAIDLVDAATTDQPRRLEVTKLAEPVYLFADRERIRQVIARLLFNASNLTDARGVIRLEVQLDGDHVVISVADNGAGIEPVELPRVFEQFFRAPRADHEQPGLVLGLPLVKALVELHGGSVSVSSEGEGKGSVFSVRLPIVSPDGNAR